VPTRVAFSRMDHPLGRAIGNALEVAEAIEYLRGANIPDLDELVTVLGTSQIKCFKMGSILKKYKTILKILLLAPYGRCINEKNSHMVPPQTNL
jgi:thymidine phosphorylase